jgi:hypothetical protein
VTPREARFERPREPGAAKFAGTDRDIGVIEDELN